MEITIEQMINYLGRDRFVKFTNTDAFPELSNEVRLFLKNYGLYSHQRYGYPRLMTDGKLKKYKDSCIEVGKNVVDDIYYIEATTGKLFMYDIDNSNARLINTSLERFLACKYTMAYYYREIEFKKKYGEYYLNNKKYAQILRNMLNEVEPGIENFPTWQDELFQKELGVI
jgi:hypothetical protein